MPFFGNILPTLRSYSGLEFGIYGKVTIGAQSSALGMNVPLSLGQRLEASGSSAVGHAFGAGRNDEISDKSVRAAQYVRMAAHPAGRQTAAIAIANTGDMSEDIARAVADKLETEGRSIKDDGVRCFVERQLESQG